MAGRGSGGGGSGSGSGETQRNSSSWKKKAKSSTNTVHCVCSSFEDSGHMVECETCSCWSHSKCVGLTLAVAPSYPFVCPLCVRSLFARLDNLSTEISALRAQVSTVTLPSSTIDTTCFYSWQLLEWGSMHWRVAYSAYCCSGISSS